MSSPGGGRGNGRDMVSVIASQLRGFRKPPERSISDRLPIAPRSPEAAAARRNRGEFICYLSNTETFPGLRLEGRLFFSRIENPRTAPSVRWSVEINLLKAGGQ